MLGVAFGAMQRSSWAAEEKKGNVYNWDSYIGETTLATFTEKTSPRARRIPRMRMRVMTEIATTIHYATPNVAAREQLSQELFSNPPIYPPK